MISKWNYLPLTTEQQKSGTELAEKYADCQPISELLVQRGIGGGKILPPLFERHALAVSDARYGQSCKQA